MTQDFLRILRVPQGHNQKKVGANLRGSLAQSSRMTGHKVLKPLRPSLPILSNSHTKLSTETSLQN